MVIHRGLRQENPGENGPGENGDRQQQQDGRHFPAHQRLLLGRMTAPVTVRMTAGMKSCGSAQLFL